MSHKVKQNKLQISRISAKLYTKSTREKVDKHKIIGNNVSKKDDSIHINQCHDYYKAITIADQKQSIYTNNIKNQNLVKLKKM